MMTMKLISDCRLVLCAHELNPAPSKVLGKDEVIDQGKEFVAEGQNMRLFWIAFFLTLLLTQELAGNPMVGVHALLLLQ